MAYSYQRATSGGTMVSLDISIDYLDRGEITVYFNDVLTTAWSWSGTTDKRILFSPAVPNGVVVMVKRTTDASKLRHYFSTGAQFTAPNLDEDLRQALHMAQEASEANLVGDFFTDINMHGFRVYNIGTAVGDADALTLGQYKADANGALQAKLDAQAAAAAAAAAVASTNTPTLPAAATLDGAELSRVYQAGAFVKTTLSNIASYAVGTFKGFFRVGFETKARTVLARLRDHFNVKDFGAVGDGVADDTVAVQAAITAAATAGNSLYFPAGVYKVTAALVIPQQHGGIEFYGDAYNSDYNLVNGIYKGSVIVSTQTSGNVLSCDGGGTYSNRGIRIRNLSMRVVTSGYAIYLKNSPEQNLIQNVNVHNANVSGGSGIGLESCWVGTRVDGCIVSAAAVGASNIGINVLHALKAGGTSIEDCTIQKFFKGVRIGDNVYQCRLVNVAAEINKYGVYIEGNDPSATLEQCHFEFNTDIAIYIKNSGGGVTVQKCTFYRNAESASVTKAEIYVSAGVSDYNYTTAIRDCWFFGVGDNVTCVYLLNPSFGSGVIENNSSMAFGTGTIGVFAGGGNLEYWEVRNNFFQGLATPYNPTSGYKSFSTALGGYNQIRFAATPVLSADPNTLDDYEEGTWTPVLGGDGGQTGQTYSEQSGYYQKVGNRVHFTFRAILTNKGTITAEAVVAGLPFTVAGASAAGAGYVSDFQNLGVSIVSAALIPNPGTGKFYLRRMTAAGASMNYDLGANIFTNTTVLVGGGTYVTNS